MTSKIRIHKTHKNAWLIFLSEAIIITMRLIKRDQNWKLFPIEIWDLRISHKIILYVYAMGNNKKLVNMFMSHGYRNCMVSILICTSIWIYAVLTRSSDDVVPHDHENSLNRYTITWWASHGLISFYIVLYSSIQHNSTFLHYSPHFQAWWMWTIIWSAGSQWRGKFNYIHFRIT